jgi:hypothetical protein
MVTGFRVFDPDPATLAWASAAHDIALDLAVDPDIRAANLRHGETWFIGVDALPNAPDGSITNIALKGPWQDHIAPPDHWHRAQVSIVYPGYPRQDRGESVANHRYRITRHAAHVDGLLPEGPARRRFLREPHAFILGLPLNLSDAAPLVVWPGSHHVMGAAFRSMIGAKDPDHVDLTDGYVAARRAVFDSITPVHVVAKPGQAILLHRHLLHGVAPWAANAKSPPEGRMIAYFRPQFTAKDWVSA